CNNRRRSQAPVERPRRIPSRRFQGRRHLPKQYPSSDEPPPIAAAKQPPCEMSGRPVSVHQASPGSSPGPLMPPHGQELAEAQFRSLFWPPLGDSEQLRLNQD